MLNSIHCKLRLTNGALLPSFYVFSFSFCTQVAKYEVHLKRDDLISHHLDLLYDNMLEANLLKIIYPYR